MYITVIWILYIYMHTHISDVCLVVLDKTRRDKTGQDKTSQVKSRQDTTQHTTRHDKDKPRHLLCHIYGMYIYTHLYIYPRTVYIIHTRTYIQGLSCLVSSRLVSSRLVSSRLALSCLA